MGSAYALAGNNDRATEYLNLASNDKLSRVSEEDRRYMSEFERGDNFGVSLNIARILNNNAYSNQRLIVQTYDALAKGQYRDAFDLAAAIIDQNRGSPIGFDLLGLTYLSQGKIDEARSNFRRAIEIDRDYHHARINLAKLEMDYGSLNAAMTSVNEMRMVEKFPDHPAGYKALGRANFSQSNFEVAVANLEKSLELFSGDEDAYLMLAKAYVSNEQLAQARGLLKNGLMHVKEILPLQRELIDLAKVDGDFANSHHYADQLKLSERTRAEGFLRQGDLNILENRAEDAINAYLSAAKAGANQEAVKIGLDKARSIAPVPVETLESLS